MGTLPTGGSIRDAMALHNLGRGGRRELVRVVGICRSCHSQVHQVRMENNSVENLAVEKLRAHLEIAKFARWIRGRPTGFAATHNARALRMPVRRASFAIIVGEPLLNTFKAPRNLPPRFGRRPRGEVHYVKCNTGAIRRIEPLPTTVKNSCTLDDSPAPTEPK